MKTKSVIGITVIFIIMVCISCYDPVPLSGPYIYNLKASRSDCNPNGSILFTADAVMIGGGEILYQWTCNWGSFDQYLPDMAENKWNAPGLPGPATITCTVYNNDRSKSSSKSLTVTINDFVMITTKHTHGGDVSVFNENTILLPHTEGVLEKITLPFNSEVTFVLIPEDENLPHRVIINDHAEAVFDTNAKKYCFMYEKTADRDLEINVVFFRWEEFEPVCDCLKDDNDYHEEELEPSCIGTGVSCNCDYSYIDKDAKASNMGTAILTFTLDPDEQAAPGYKVIYQIKKSNPSDFAESYFFTPVQKFVTPSQSWSDIQTDIWDAEENNDCILFTQGGGQSSELQNLYFYRKVLFD